MLSQTKTVPGAPHTVFTHTTPPYTQACYLLLWSLTFTRLLPPDSAARLSPLSFLAMGYGILLNLHWVSQARTHTYMYMYIDVHSDRYLSNYHLPVAHRTSCFI